MTEFKSTTMFVDSKRIWKLVEYCLFWRPRVGYIEDLIEQFVPISNSSQLFFAHCWSNCLPLSIFVLSNANPPTCSITSLTSEIGFSQNFVWTHFSGHGCFIFFYSCTFNCKIRQKRKQNLNQNQWCNVGRRLISSGSPLGCLHSAHSVYSHRCIGKITSKPHMDIGQKQGMADCSAHDYVKIVTFPRILSNHNHLATRPQQNLKLKLDKKTMRFLLSWTPAQHLRHVSTESNVETGSQYFLGGAGLLCLFYSQLHFVRVVSFHTCLPVCGAQYITSHCYRGYSGIIREPTSVWNRFGNVSKPNSNTK